MPGQNREGNADVLTSRGSDAIRHPPHHHDHHDTHNRNAQHGDALRLMLGSILAPKRPNLSRSSSGTASPAHSSFSFSNAQSASPSPQPSASFNYPHIHPYPHIHNHLHSHPHPNHPHPQHQHHFQGHPPSHSHSHAPSNLGSTPVTPEHDHSPSNTPSNLPSPIPELVPPNTPFFSSRPGCMSRSESSSSARSVEVPVKPDIIVTQVASTSGQSTPVDLSSGGNSLPGSGAGTPPKNNKFLQQLKGKSAWEALIHGSFS